MTTDDRGVAPDGESPPGTPLWVKAFGIVVIVLVLLFVALHLTGNVPTHTPSSSATLWA
jgi:hypothetical protein